WAGGRLSTARRRTPEQGLPSTPLSAAVIWDRVSQGRSGSSLWPVSQAPTWPTSPGRHVVQTGLQARCG
ncbi:MAG: hypothetical protein ABIQ53_13400, partial [Terracoccus sp.]